MKNFGVNLTTLEPGAWSAHRHWHTRQDEMIYLLEGELTLVTDGGRQVLKPGAVVGFPANSGEGHNLINTGTITAIYLEIGDRLPGDDVFYPDVDLTARQNAPSYRFTKRMDLSSDASLPVYTCAWKSFASVQYQAKEKCDDK